MSTLITGINKQTEKIIQEDLGGVSTCLISNKKMNTDSLFVPPLSDPATELARHCFEKKNHEEARLVWEEGRIVVKPRLPCFTHLFYRIFSCLFSFPAYEAYLAENRKTLAYYQTFVIRACGVAKAKEIQAEYGFDFGEMMADGSPLSPKLVYKCNIGMNDIGMADVDRFADEMRSFLSSLTQSDLRQRTGTHLPFSLRTIQGLIALIGPDQPLQTLKTRFEGLLLADSRKSSSHLPRALFEDCMQVLVTPDRDWDAIFTGRKIQQTIAGYYFDKPWAPYLRPWLDQQELLQTFPELKKADERSFHELLVKIVVKKHLMRVDRAHHWRVGALIPAPSLDGRARWLRVDEGVDSGRGKFWYTLKPACKEEDTLGVYRLYRDTSISPYMQGGGGSLLRDISPSHSIGYLYRDSTEQQDEAFFKKATTPIWVAHLLQGRLLESLYSKMQIAKGDPKRHAKLLLHPDLPREVKRALLRKETAAIKEFLTRCAEEAGEIKEGALFGKIKSPVYLLGNSLGAFDAQYDLKKFTADRGRIPITPIHLYGHSGVRIEEKDDLEFFDFMKPHLDAMQALGGSLDFDYLLEFKKDLVPECGDQHTYLGKKLKALNHPACTASLRVYEVLENRTHPELEQLGPHFKRLESARLRGDLKQLDHDFESFDAYANQTGWEKMRRAIGSILYPLAKGFLNAKRRLKSRRGMSWENRSAAVRSKYKFKRNLTEFFQQKKPQNLVANNKKT